MKHIMKCIKYISALSTLNFQNSPFIWYLLKGLLLTKNIINEKVNQLLVWLSAFLVYKHTEHGVLVLKNHTVSLFGH